jgi:hypothetical protein
MGETNARELTILRLTRYHFMCINMNIGHAEELGPFKTDTL